MLIIETPFFSKHIYSYLTDDEYLEFQEYIIDHAQTGKIIKGAKGLRKIRWSSKDKGKRSGVRIIYYYKNKQGKIFLLHIYSKNELIDISIHKLKEYLGALENE